MNRQAAMLAFDGLFLAARLGSDGGAGAGVPDQTVQCHRRWWRSLKMEVPKRVAIIGICAKDSARGTAPARGGKLDRLRSQRGRARPVVVELRADERHANPMGTVHGGILCDIADMAMGIAYASTLSEDETFTTLELKINFLRPVWKSTLRAEGKVVQTGKTVGLVACDITDEQGHLVARASSTCMTLRGAAAHGR